MSYEATICCDRCSRVITAADTARAAREENRYVGGVSRPPFDLCQGCVALGHKLPARVAEPDLTTGRGDEDA